MFVSLYGTAVGSLVNVAQNALVSGNEARRWGNAHPNLVPYQVFEASDRPMVIAVGNDGQWRSCARALGLDQLAADERLARNAGRLEHRDVVVAAMAARIAEEPAASWLPRLAAVGVPAGVVRSVREALADVEASPLTGVSPSPPGEVRFAPPRLNEHGRLIRRHGWDAFRHAAVDVGA
jgi:crotonobetainyl-CoA:carnitine CoA-transferase CaiB-like acyl-CoA transferase